MCNRSFDNAYKPLDSVLPTSTLFQTPCSDGYNPLKNVARARQQCGEGQNVFLNVIPFVANESTFGVIALL